MNAPRNVWLIAGTSAFALYPCRCFERRGRAGGKPCDPAWCPCAGRLDVWNFEPACCAWWATPAVVVLAKRAYDVARAQRAYDAGRDAA